MKPLCKKEVSGISIGTLSLTHVHANFLTNTCTKHTLLHHAEQKQKAVLMYAVLTVVWPDGLIYGFIMVLITPKALTVTTFCLHITAGLATF